MRTPEEWAEFLDTLKEWAEELRAETAEYEMDVINEHGDDGLARALAAVKVAALGVEHAVSPLISVEPAGKHAIVQLDA